MIDREYDIMAKLEHEFWWHQGSEKIFQAILCQGVKGALVLNAGCGTGRLTDWLEKENKVIAVDINKKALGYCKRKGHKNLIRANVNELPLKQKFDLVVITDVLYHKGVCIEKTLSEINRVLKKGGLLLLNEPAFEFLRSSHDRAMETQKRFTKGEIKRLLEKNGFEIIKLTYWNFFLFFPIALMRILKKSSDVETSDIKEINPLLNKILYFILLVESKIIKFTDLPFGVSVCCLAQKAENS